jgi:3-oxoacyl-(acyl-carrier-protein) synthase
MSKEHAGLLLLARSFNRVDKFAHVSTVYAAGLSAGTILDAPITGYGSTGDAGHLTQPSVDGPRRAMRLALEEGNTPVSEVDYINAHGKGTPINDVVETRAIHEVFGSSIERLAVSSTNSMHGHLMGASGALELLITVLAILREVIPLTINYRTRDPGCDLDYTPNEPRHRVIRSALSNSFALGGVNAVIALRRV